MSRNLKWILASVIVFVLVLAYKAWAQGSLLGIRLVQAEEVQTNRVSLMVNGAAVPVLSVDASGKPVLSSQLATPLPTTLTLDSLTIKDPNGKGRIVLDTVKDAAGQWQPQIRLLDKDNKPVSEISVDADGHGFLRLASPGTPMAQLESLPPVGLP